MPAILNRSVLFEPIKTSARCRPSSACIAQHWFFVSHVTATRWSFLVRTTETVSLDPKQGSSCPYSPTRMSAMNLMPLGPGLAPL